MARTGLDGPFKLNYNEINLVVSQGHCGVFALGEINADRRFAISFVGAGYADVRRALMDRIGTANMFKLQAGMTPHTAFVKLCEMFHTFHPSGNFVHPERPEGTTYQCPYCSAPEHRIRRVAVYR